MTWMHAIFDMSSDAVTVMLKYQLHCVVAVVEEVR